MNPAVLIVIYCLLIVMVSLVGGWLPSIMKLTHLRMQVVMSFVSGIMLGVAVLHLLPHSTEYVGSISKVGAWMLAGVLVMFFLLRVFHVHYHGETEHGHHDHDCGHDHADDQVAVHHRISWVGLFFGLAVHTLLDGVALSASVVAEASDKHSATALLGLGTFLAVLLHKPLDALSITSIMSAGGWSVRSQTLVNCAFALACPLGALLFWFGVSQMSEGQNAVVGYALAFSAGFFLCIALSDLLPEVQFHAHDRFKLSAALLLGVALAIGIESLHSHDHGKHDHSSPHSHQHEHEH